MTKEELEKKRDIIHNQINELYDIIFEVENKKAIYDKIEELNDELDKICDEIVSLEPVIASNEYVDLKRQDDLTFIIFIHGTDTVVGSIDYRKYHCSEEIGDIGYIISRKYRGKNYAYYALCALSNYLKENNIPDFWISTYKDNLPSYNTIKKYGGKIIKEEDNFIMYECSTSKKK